MQLDQNRVPIEAGLAQAAPTLVMVKLELDQGSTHA